MIDNYDSFTFNLVHYFEALSLDVLVLRNDEVTLSQIRKLNPEYIVISPGPCTPNEAGICLELVKEFAGKVPLLGVCLGHQIIAQAFGAKVIRSKKVMHGKSALIEHSGKGLFWGLNNPLNVVRYHSLIVDLLSLPTEFDITARCGDEIMALSHKAMPIVSVQFHPESILSEQGHDLLKNFINIK